MERKDLTDEEKELLKAIMDKYPIIYSNHIRVLNARKYLEDTFGPEVFNYGDLRMKPRIYSHEAQLVGRDRLILFGSVPSTYVNIIKQTGHLVQVQFLEY